MNSQNNTQLDPQLHDIDAQLEQMLKPVAPQGLEDKVFNASFKHLTTPQQSIIGRIHRYIKPLAAAAAILFAASLLWTVVNHHNSFANMANMTLAEQVEAYEAYTGGLGDPIDQEIRTLIGDVDRVATALSDSSSTFDHIDNPVNSVYEDLAAIEAEIAM